MSNTKQKKTDIREVFKALAVPFPAEAVRVKVQSVVKKKKSGGAWVRPVPYITARDAMNRLDEVLGCENWEATFTLLQAGEAQQKITKDGEVKRAVVRPWVFLCTLRATLPDGQVVTKQDVGEGDDAKAAVSDALKRAAVHLGVARYLYETEDVWLDVPEGDADKPERWIRRNIEEVKERLGL